MARVPLVLMPLMLVPCHAMAAGVVTGWLLRGRVGGLAAEQHRRSCDPLEGERGHHEPCDEEAKGCHRS